VTKTKQDRWRKLKISLLVLLVLIGTGAFVGWYKFFREEPQPGWVTATPEMRFKYGSIGGENTAGIPYWIFYVLPRMFPEYLPGPGGYASIGVPWEQGQELPVGFSKKVVGFPRVANTCAVCHTSSYRTTKNENPTFVEAGPGNATNVQAFFKFFIDCAKDPRFNADNVLREIELVTHLSWLDKVLYRFVIIPFTKKTLLQRENQFAWLYRSDFPAWGRGRDDAMNLTKYFMIKLPMDDTFGPTDMPSIWNLKKYDPEPLTMNWDGASHDAYSVIIDSALGILGDRPKHKNEFLGHIRWLEEYLRAKQAPKYPFSIDQQKAASGKNIFENNCARCHASNQTGKPVPVAEVGTDRNRLDTWSKNAAIAANKVVKDLGIERKGLVEEPMVGYIAVHLDGVWLRAPYLHNGSIPTLRDLLEPLNKRPPVFYRGFDVYDPVNVGFDTKTADAQQVGSKIDVTQKGNGNQGHLYGTTLSLEEKDALIEYMKTL
jgi:mono/diheme cytochrome c family protein